jgi:CheY-like chemotaxis protein
MAKKILIIDDDDAIQQVIKSALLSEGYEVSVADDGQEGLKLMKELQPDLIMLDIMMPVMGGMEFMKANKDKSIPVIIITSLNTNENEKKFKELGVNHFLHKSDIHIDDIKKIVAEVLKK